MANRAFTPVMFGLEKNIVHLSAHINFGTAGAPTLDSSNSLGFCAVSAFTQSFTATASSTASFTAVSDFTNLYNGMIISGTNIAAGSVVSAINAGAGTFTSSHASTGVVSAVVATGGYKLQLGTDSSRLDPYAKLLGFSVLMSESGLAGGASTQASVPAAPSWFILQNNISDSTKANIVLICGYFDGATFTQVQPASGEKAHVQLMLSNSTAK